MTGPAQQVTPRAARTVPQPQPPLARGAFPRERTGVPAARAGPDGPPRPLPADQQDALATTYRGGTGSVSCSTVRPDFRTPVRLTR
ncbi:hypothetical protein [Streptomyces albipurpureus]|uniref:Uncharacterized protein n=1 Tax=Streptomyces albipurpureus TaxID=2897419 RepID=A0ABT0UTF6_9ACTN|nr:hypothetical protein [Streptomyces sp. CWNU-1]MCM2391873.1 hypothetical protein [Streptomyces sp. CWNU-1]